jgi:hypothetical protein
VVELGGPAAPHHRRPGEAVAGLDDVTRAALDVAEEKAAEDA